MTDPVMRFDFDEMLVSYPWTVASGIGVSPDDYSRAKELFLMRCCWAWPFPFCWEPLPDGTPGVIFVCNGWKAAPEERYGEPGS